MESEELGNLIEEPARSFESLRCPCSDHNNEMTELLEQTFRMISLNDNSLVSCGHESCMLWEITDNTVQLVRCIIKPGSAWFLTSMFSLDDGTHFLTCQVNGAQSKVSLYSIHGHAPLYELVFDHLILNVIPVSLDCFLDLTHSDVLDLLVYSMKKPGQCLPLKLPDEEYLSIKKLPGVNHLIVILYSHHMDMWNVTEQTCSLLNHYVFQSVYLAVYIQIIDSSKIILMSEEAGLQGETLLCLKNFDVISETRIPDRIEGDVVCPFSSSTVMTVTSSYDRMGDHVEVYTIHSLLKNKSFSFTQGLYADERHSLFCFLLPDTLDIVVFTTHAKFFKYKIADELAHLIKYAELRKNSRVLSQAHRTLSGQFSKVPVEICLKIVALTDHSLPEDQARRIASLYFCKPSSDYS